MNKKQAKKFAFIAFSLLAMVGTYNAVMINSESGMSGSNSNHRFGEMLGVVVEGRTPAVTSQWIKLEKQPVVQVATVQSSVKVENTVVQESPSQAAIQDSLSLKLVEVMNPKKWDKGVNASEFTGTIATNNGIIETLSANLPEGINIEIAFSEMTGNTFEYDLNGKVYAGMMYQVDQGSYMITLSNGPLEGTRLRFAGEVNDSSAETKEYLAETHNVEVGTFGEESDAPQAEVEADTSIQTAEAPSFNFDQI